MGSLLSSLYPAFTTLLAVTVLREGLRAAQWVGVVLALVGAGLIAGR
ncbi:EamA family transporter [Deinococcus radiopugnans]